MLGIVKRHEIPDVIKRQIDIVTKVNNREENPLALTTPEVRGLPQRIKKHINYLLLQDFKAMCNLDDPLIAEMIRSITSPEAGLYLNADPSERRFQIRDDYFLLHTKRRLQLNVINRTDMKCKSCKKFVDVKVEHTFCCVHVGKNSVHAPIVKSVVLHVRELLGDTLVVA